MRTRIMLLAVFLVCIATFSIAYITEKEGVKLLLQEKKEKLLTLARVLDMALGDGFARIDTSLPRNEQIQILNQKLAPTVEHLLQNSQKIGAGYYHKALDAIIIYGPQTEHGDKIGVSIAADHPGRQVMASGESAVWLGPQVRGNIMNAMMPIIRHGETIGYAWTNELIEDINAQAMALDKKIVLICLLGLLSSIILAFFLSHRLNNDIDIIKKGLIKLPFDLRYRLPPLRGEMNDVVAGVNQLASALNDSKSLNEMILDSTIDGVITVDKRGVITMMNPAAEKIIGARLAAVIGKPYASLIADENYQSLLLDTLYHGNNHNGIELDFPVSGRTVHISLSTSHLKNHHDESIGAVIIFKDLSEQREMQRVIQQTERLVAIGELMAGVAHEIRNPLTAIRGFVQYLQKHEISQEKQKEYIHIILKEVDSINDVIRQLLDLSKPHKKYYSPAHINQLIQDTLILVNTSRHTPQIRFITELDTTLPELYLDHAMIKQMLLNLIINAIQAIDGAGTIIIRTYRSTDEKMLCIDIQDSGSGISADIRKHLFTPFFTTKPAGTGLGLSIVEKIAASHRGHITIGNHPDGGALARISLPIT